MFIVAIEVSRNKSIGVAVVNKSVAVDPYGSCAKCNAEKVLPLFFLRYDNVFLAFYNIFKKVVASHLWRCAGKR